MKVERANRITAFGERLEKREKAEKEGGCMEYFTGLTAHYGDLYWGYSILLTVRSKSMNPRSMNESMTGTLLGLDCNTLS